MGKDKVESLSLHVEQDQCQRSLTDFIDEELIKYAWPQDLWFHVDKLSSAHVYLRMSEGMTWDNIPQTLLVDCAQLVKANSIEGAYEHSVILSAIINSEYVGNKKDNITIIYTPGDNLKVKATGGTKDFIN